MVRGIRDRATQAPGYGSFGNVVFNPTADLAIQKIFDVNQLSDFGIKFPFQNGSTAILNQASNTTLSPTNGVLYYDELNISAGAVVDVGASPCFIFARKVSIAAGCVLHCDARGGAGGAATTGGAGATSQGANGNAGTVGNTGGQGDLGATTVTNPPQFYKGITTGGAGGGSGASGGGGGNSGASAQAGGTGAAGKNGGAGGRTDATHGNPNGGTGGAGGGTGG